MADIEKPNSAPIDPKAEAWLKRVAAYERKFSKWEKRAKSISEKYRDYDDADGDKKKGSEFNILWSNIQVLMPATFARLPKPDVSRRWRDNDPVGRVAALLLERALSFEVEHYPDYRAAMTNSVLDRFLGGRGTAWVRYEPHFSATADMPDDGVMVTTDADEADPEQQAEEVEYECAPVDYVHWKDFGHTLARTWEEVTGVWRKVYMSREALKERFGDKAAGVPLDKRPDTASNADLKTSNDDQELMALIYEIWDKSTSTALWVAGSICRVLDERPDPLQLENFWPCPRPLFATTTTDNLVPVPDYKLYQDQAEQLNLLSTRISGLIKMLEVKGVHDAAVPELARLFKEAGNGDLIPVKNFAAFAEKNGLSGSIDIFDITPIVNALNVAYEAEEKVKNQIYELMGVSDIARGASDPTETFGAQKLKGQYGNMRLRSKQDEVVQFATALLQIKAQIMCQHFQPKTFLKIAAAEQLMPEDQQLVPQALQLLMGERAVNPGADTADGPLAAFRVEVSSDSMVQMDEQQEKGERLEFISAFTGFLEKVIPAVKETPQLAPLAVSIMKFGVSGFKVGKTMEGMIDQMLDQMTKQAAQPQPEKPDPEMAKVQAQSQAKQAEMQQKAQLDQQHLQAEAQLELSRQQSQAKEEEYRNHLEGQRAAQQQQFDQQLEAQRVASDKALEETRGQIQLLITAMNNANKLEVAEIASQTTLDAAQVSAAQAATQEEQ